MKREIERSSVGSPVAIPKAMTGVLLVGHGGFDKLVYRDDIPVPVPGRGEVLIKVAAAGINNTDINTRIGWYSKGVKSGTEEGGAQGFESFQDADATWAGAPMSFPRIQGIDCCGRIVAVGDDVDQGRIGERVIVRNMLRSYVDYRPMEHWALGSECDGAFAQFTKAPSRETHSVNCDWSDVELASVPCSYSTAEGMLHRAVVKQGEHVVITGASGGVGSAAVQLAKRRGAVVTAVAGLSKAEQIRDLGADRVVARGDSLVKHLGKEAVDVVIDVAAGPAFADLLDVLKKGGRYAVAGAIAGPIVELDVRTLYLKDLTFFGCTLYDEVVFDNLVSYIEKNEIRPFVGKTYPLKDIVKAQQEFLSKTISGKLVLVLPE
ncbi:alcohol dehydrogenase family protein [Mesorhizobium sp. LSJC264A00]|uniref:alcohol dehydrogenase family protein n=1 Tax=unclassified Mesorhizobium TaxID=325217 RepID=UPI00040FDC3B|nr:alcohol dehydrogenase family protein [Mesorhizobium sp. LSJC264A00]